MKKLASVILSALLMQCHVAALAEEAVSVKGIEVSPDAVLIKTDQPVRYDAFTASQPARLVVDLMNSKLQSETKKITGLGKFLKAVQAEQYQTAPVSITRLTLELAEKAAYDIVAAKGALAVFLKSPVSSPEAAPAPGQDALAPEAAKEQVNSDILANLSKEAVSLDYDSADIKGILDMLAYKRGLNLVYTDDVSGDVTIKLNNVPFNEAFATVLAMKNLSAQQIGANIIRIATAQTVVTERSQAAPATRLFKLNYLKAADAQTLINSIIVAEGRTGKVNVDPYNNVLAVTDIPSGLESISRIISQLDKKPAQVLIETKIVEVNLQDSLDLGISWTANGTGSNSIAGKNGKTFFGSSQLESDMDTNGYVVRPNGTQSPWPNAANSGGFGVANNLTDSNVGSFRFGWVSNNTTLDMTLTAAMQNGKAKVLSNPKVATLNNMEAKINITTQIPYTTTDVTTSGGGSVTSTKVVYIDTGIQLAVTPQVNADGRITLKVKPSVSQKATTVATAAGGAPGVDKRDVETNVMTKDGETIVIGGLIYDSQSDTVYKVPLLGDIPLLGWLFKQKSNTRQRIELLIFVTPRLVEG